jgi:hypothetical protein
VTAFALGILSILSALGSVTRKPFSLTNVVDTIKNINKRNAISAKEQDGTPTSGNGFFFSFAISTP